jgi:hypothetical protein
MGNSAPVLCTAEALSGWGKVVHGVQREPDGLECAMCITLHSTDWQDIASQGGDDVVVRD